MEGQLILRGTQRRCLLRLYRSCPDPAVRLRAHLLLLLAEGYPWALIAAVLFCSTATLARWKGRFEEGGVEALAGLPRGPEPELARNWAATAAGWVRHYRPRDFALRRSRWCCRLVVVLMLELHGVEVSPESVRLWLHQGGLAWRRPRPALARKDPLYEQKVEAIRTLLAGLAAQEAAVFQDETDLDLNPKLGGMWMPVGEQAKVDTPGTNRKRVVAGSLVWGRGTLITTAGAERQGRDTDLFLAHLDELRKRLGRFEVIHVICDNGPGHKGRRVDAYLEQARGRVRLHYLPVYAPETNPIERVWWLLHEEVSRDHACGSIQELLDQALAWLAAHGPFQIQDLIYFPDKAA
jgi:putative transposase